jgi:hypothetical protein
MFNFFVSIFITHSSTTLQIENYCRYRASYKQFSIVRSKTQLFSYSIKLDREKIKESYFETRQAFFAPFSMFVICAYRAKTFGIFFCIFRYSKYDMKNIKMTHHGKLYCV